MKFSPIYDNTNLQEKLHARLMEIGRDVEADAELEIGAGKPYLDTYKQYVTKCSGELERVFNAPMIKEYLERHESTPEKELYRAGMKLFVSRLIDNGSRRMTFLLLDLISEELKKDKEMWNAHFKFLPELNENMLVWMAIMASQQPVDSKHYPREKLEAEE